MGSCEPPKSATLRPIQIVSSAQKGAHPYPTTHVVEVVSEAVSRNSLATLNLSVL